MGDDLSISADASPRRQLRNVSKIVVHPSYTSNEIPIFKTRRNIDIAVLFVRRKSMTFFIFFFSFLNFFQGNFFFLNLALLVLVYVSIMNL